MPKLIGVFALSEQNEIIAAFSAERPTYKAFTISAKESIRRVLEEHGVIAFAYESRCKTIESFSEKVTREGKEGKYFKVGDVTDVVGIRVITYLNEDCMAAAEIIRNHFEIDFENSVSKEDELGDDRFGYQSTHLIISYDSNRLALPEFKRFNGIKAEVQIKTLLQHTWAAIDWKLRYKSAVDAPRTLRRRLHRISALLDAADDEFSFVSIETVRIRKEYEEAIQKGDLSASIDRESVEAFLTAPDQLYLINRIADGIVNFKLKAVNEKGVSILILTLERIKVNSLNQLSSLIKNKEIDIIKKVGDMRLKWQPEKITSSNGATLLAISLIVLLPKEEAIDLVKETDFTPTFKVAFLEYLRNIIE